MMNALQLPFIAVRAVVGICLKWINFLEILYALFSQPRREPPMLNVTAEEPRTGPQERPLATGNELSLQGQTNDSDHGPVRQTPNLGDEIGTLRSGLSGPWAGYQSETLVARPQSLKGDESPSNPAQSMIERPGMDTYLRGTGSWNPIHPPDSTSYPKTLSKVHEELISAINSDKWRKRNERPYSEVKVLMMSWEKSSNGISTELARLAECFETEYQYDVTQFAIPKDHRATTEALTALLRFSNRTDKCDREEWPQRLLILYYTGHGSRDSRGTHRWIPGQEPNERGSVDIDPEAFIGTFTGLSRDNRSDALILLDCCHPGIKDSPRDGDGHFVCEILAACAEGEARGPGNNSFTTLLVNELYAAGKGGESISVRKLHSHLVANYHHTDPKVKFRGNSSTPVQDDKDPSRPMVTDTVRRVPHYRLLSEKANNAGCPCIVLTPSPKRQPSEPGYDRSHSSNRGTEVILSFHVVEDSDDVLLGLKKWVFLAPEIAESFKVLTVLPCNSSILILQMPVELWDLLPSSPAVTLLGYVNVEGRDSTPTQTESRVTDGRGRRHSQTADLIQLPSRLPSPQFMWNALDQGIVFWNGTMWRNRILHMSWHSSNKLLITSAEKKEARKRRVFPVDHKGFNRQHDVVKGRALTWDGSSNVPLVEGVRAMIAGSSGAEMRSVLHQISAVDQPVTESCSVEPTAHWDARGPWPRNASDFPLRRPESALRRELKCLGHPSESSEVTSESEATLEYDTTQRLVQTPEEQDRKGSNTMDNELEDDWDAINGEAQDQGSQDPLKLVESDLSVEDPSRFTTGTVFKLLWTEPLDQESPLDDTGGLSNSERDIMSEANSSFDNTSHSEQNEFWAGFLRFIVVSNDGDYCTCVPISTYGGKACSCEEVQGQAATHGIIFQDGNRPQRLEGEPELGVAPVKVELLHNDDQETKEKIARESRVHYAKTIRIPHSVKVRFIGRLDIEGIEVMKRAVQPRME